MCFGCSKEPSQWDGSFEYPQHKFWLKKKKNDFSLGTLIWGPDKYAQSKNNMPPIFDSGNTKMKLARLIKNRGGGGVTLYAPSSTIPG